MFEYILIAGVNDTDEQARELAKIARRLSAKINLIPTTPSKAWNGHAPRARAGTISIHPAEARCGRTLRREKGHDIAAACGQVTTANEASRTRGPAFSLTRIEKQGTTKSRQGISAPRRLLKSTFLISY
jgi:Predicted Fe-S-cluster redox enzyme